VAALDFALQQEFAKGLARQLGVSITGSHAGVVLYTTESVVVAGLVLRSLEQFDATLDGVTQISGGTFFGQALQVANETLFGPSGRAGITKAVVLVTDGTDR
jgi:hypothetical protein